MKKSMKTWMVGRGWGELYESWIKDEGGKIYERWMKDEG